MLSKQTPGQGFLLALATLSGELEKDASVGRGNPARAIASEPGFNLC